MNPFVLLFCLLFSTTLCAQDPTDLSSLSYSELDSLMLLNYYKGNYQGTIPYLLQGRDKVLKERAVADASEWLYLDSIYIEFIGNLGTFYSLLGDYEKAEPCLVEQLGLIKKMYGEEHDHYANVNHNIADFYRSTGNYEAAEKLYLKAIKIKQLTKGKENIEYAIFINNLGLLYWRIHQYEKAEGLYLEAEAINLKNYGEEHPQHASIINNLALLYTSMEDYKKAETFYLRSKKIKEATIGKNHPDYASLLKNLGNLYNDTKRYEKAESAYQEVLKLYKSLLGTDHPRYASALNDLAFLYIKTKKYATAEKLYFQSLGIIEGSLKKEHPFYALTLNNMALLYCNMNRLDTALTYNMASIAILTDSFEQYFPRIFKDPSNLNLGCQLIDEIDFSALSKLIYHDFSRSGECLNTLLKIVEKLPQQKIYYQVSEAAIKIQIKIKNEFMSEENKLGVLARNTEFVRHGIQASYKLGTAYYDRAFEFAEQNKSILLAEAIQGSRARVLGDLPDTLAQKEMELSKQKDELKKQRHQTADAVLKAKIISQENTLNQEIEVFLQNLKETYPRYHQLKYENITAKVSEVQALLAPKTMLLEYFVSDTMVYLFAITPNTVKLLELDISRLRLYREVKRLRLALSHYDMIANRNKKAYQLYTQKAYWCYSNLLESALKGADVENLIIVADAVLGQIPFEVFLMKDIQQEQISYEKMPYLLKDYTISYNYSATLWKENLKTEGQVNNHKLLACAASYAPVEEKDTKSVLSKWRSSSTMELRANLSPLPKAEEEVRTLAENFQGDFKFQDACNEAFFKEEAAKYGLIHLAMHGLFDPEIPILSSLVFTENGDSLEDNLLQAYEIAHLKLNADLVVLSACETGYGKYERGDGIRSLARSFMYAGVPSMVVSLWQVNDYSTAQLMASFYDYLAEGLPKDKALRQAKLDYLNNNVGLTAHPAFWSPFIQLGNNSSIELTRPTNWNRWIFGVLLAVFLTIGWRFFIKKRA
jgi:CHAT domain-containing protein/Flp pilus assembly protein TadD